MLSINSIPQSPILMMDHKFIFDAQDAANKMNRSASFNKLPIQDINLRASQLSTQTDQSLQGRKLCF